MTVRDLHAVLKDLIADGDGEAYVVVHGDCDGEEDIQCVTSGRDIRGNVTYSVFLQTQQDLDWLKVASELEDE